jgi:hypothetical protein
MCEVKDTDNLGLKKNKEKSLLEDLGIDGRILLKCMF